MHNGGARRGVRGVLLEDVSVMRFIESCIEGKEALFGKLASYIMC